MALVLLQCPAARSRVTDKLIVQSQLFSKSNQARRKLEMRFYATVRLTIRSTRTLPLRGTVLDDHSDFPSLFLISLSAAPVSLFR